MIYRALHTASKEKGDPCYLPRNGGFITREKSKAKEWKTKSGIGKWMDREGTAAGYEVEAE